MSAQDLYDDSIEQSINTTIEFSESIRTYFDENDEFVSEVIFSPETFLRDFVECPKGHYTHNFLACDFFSECYLQEGDAEYSDYTHAPLVTSCPVPLTPLPPYFPCENGLRIPYNFVCDKT